MSKRGGQSNLSILRVAIQSEGFPRDTIYEDNRAGISSLPFALQVLQIPYYF